jgi:hypothetical protein
MAEHDAYASVLRLRTTVYFARADVLALHPTTLSIFRAGVCLESD